MWLTMDPGAGSPMLGLAKAIQLSVAPVFLLTAIAGLLSVISNRLARVLDRAQRLQSIRDEAMDLALLKRRMTLLTRASEAVTTTGVLVAAVVAVTFISAIAVIDLTAIVVPLFVVAMLSLMVGLLTLLLDTRVSARLIRRRF
ncbi:MAG: DUF2721 domain-containing protein [Synechococcus sp. XM-24]|nr:MULTISPECIES: DUF2721 domain-containing protein [Synechococcaceae]PWL23084.1 MAG: DUF2721 domain-containing protein [Synechococcus sp. XM-24]UPH91465.1 DUF2721 domain-containing protein [Synechococcus sp. NB0720_010]